MKILLYGDAHFSLNSSILVGTSNSLDGRLRHLIDSFKWMYGVAKDLKVDKIIDLGDLVDDFRLSAEEITAVTDALTMNNFVDEIHILGNHERLAEDGTINSVNFVDAIPHHSLIREPLFDEENSMTFLPYAYYEDGDLDSFPKTKYAFTHLDIFGSDMGTGLSLKLGMSPAYLSGRYDYVLNGHVHVHSYVMDYPDKKIVNLGSISGQNFSSKGTPHIAVLDTETGALEFIENPKALYFTKGNCETVSDVLHLVNSLDPERDYAIQVNVPMGIADDVREILSGKDYILSSRIRVKADVSQLEAVEQEEIEKVSSTSGGFQKLRDFIEEAESLPYDKDDILKVVAELEGNKFSPV